MIQKKIVKSSSSSSYTKSESPKGSKLIMSKIDLEQMILRG